MFAVAIPVDGAMTVTQSGRQCTVNAQSACLIDMTRAFHIEHPGVTTQLVLQLPRDILLGRYPHFGRFTTCAFNGSDNGTALLRDLLLRCLSYIPALDELQRTSLFWVILDMLGLPKIGADETEWRVHKALAYIRAHLNDEDLSAHEVARAQAISRRSLDELFCRVRGRPVAAEIADVRLVLASEALRDPSQARRTIGEIAFNLGFEHAAHFTRAFGRRFGVTPRDWRGGRGRSH
jgi:AraC-like DNA-binding protein